ncbi:hypothetical protein C8J57DRAFT_305999, partial [Mycena rebaudengoi]
SPQDDSDGLALKLEDLAEDILCLILVLCDIYTVLSLPRVNKSLRRIAYSKQIWIYLIDDLAARGLIDLPHDCPLQEYSTAELMDEVQRIVLGPKTWSRPTRAAPIISREFRILSSRPDAQQRFFSVQLLPGGTHLVVEYTSRIELWHVATSAVIWFLEDNWTFSREYRYSIELCNAQRSAILVTLDTLRLLRLIRIDLRTGESTEIFKVEASQGAVFGRRPIISGDFFGCEWESASWPDHYFMVDNWRTEKTVIINYNPHAAMAVWLFPLIDLAAHHIFLTARLVLRVFTERLLRSVAAHICDFHRQCHQHLQSAYAHSPRITVRQTLSTLFQNKITIETAVSALSISRHPTRTRSSTGHSRHRRALLFRIAAT